MCKHRSVTQTISLCALGVALFSAQPLLAQSVDDDENADTAKTRPDTETLTTGDGAIRTRRTFTPEDFARFAPRSALDMARQVPGFSIQEGDGARGLGQADTNVIINSRRISGKSNGPVAALGRIPTEEVIRLELVDGASLDIGGLTGQVLNVVTSNSGGVTGQFRYAPRFRSEGTPARLLDGSLSLAGGGEKTQWTLALQNDSNRRGNAGLERVFDAADTLSATRDEQLNINTDRPSASGSFTRIADNGNVLNLTGEVQGFFLRQTEISRQSDIAGIFESERQFTETEDEFNFEIGADYQFEFAGGRLKLIGYNRFENSPRVARQLRLFADGTPLQETVFASDADEGETIARAEFSFDKLDGNFVLALEGARNFLERTSTLEERVGDGGLQNVDLPGADARVDEDRADFGATYGRSLAANLQLQASAGGEYSKISQSGPFGQTREFWRPKGFVALDWNAAPAINIAARAERVVGQLDFFDFIASVDLDQDRLDVTNADLVPQQSWVYEIEASLGLGALGTLNLRPFYEEISDIVDQVPIAGGGQAPGNLESAQVYGIDGDATLLSEGLGWRGTRLDLAASVSNSSLIDPLLGFERRFSDEEKIRIDADLRHDFAGRIWAVGGSYNWRDNAPSVRLDEVSLDIRRRPFLSAFVENKDVAGMTLRATVANLADRRDLFSRTVFIDRAADIPAFAEQRVRTFGTIFTLEVEGSF